MYCGFDIGGTKVLGVAVGRQDEAESVRDTVAPVAVRSEVTIESGAAVIGVVEKMVEMLESDCSASFSAVGVGIAGIVDEEGVLRYSPNIEGVFDLEMRRRLQDSLGRPVVVENDANAATWAEWRLGAGHGSRHMLLVALGTGIGTGFVLDGRLYRGWNGFAGESGHMVVELSGPRHLTGVRGPWEYYASGPGLGRLARAAAARGDFDGIITEAGSISAIRGEHVHARITAGDPDALSVLDEFCRYVAVGVANLVHVLDPEVVVIAGGLVDIGAPLTSGIQAWTHRYVLGGKRRPRVRVVPAQLGSQAGAVGAALLAREVS